MTATPSWSIVPRLGLVMRGCAFSKDAYQNHLQRIEGQGRGLERMIDDAAKASEGLLRT
jgi:hypothetical protein